MKGIKRVVIDYPEAEYKRLVKLKGDQTWKEIVAQGLLPKDSDEMIRARRLYAYIKKEMKR